jgi:hypothetical protein
VKQMSVFEIPKIKSEAAGDKILPGKVCKECGNATLIKKIAASFAPTAAISAHTASAVRIPLNQAAVDGCIVSRLVVLISCGARMIAGKHAFLSIINLPISGERNR